MSLLSVKLNSLGIGSERLAPKEIYSVHQDRIEQILLNLFSKSGIQGNPQKTPFTLQLKAEGPLLSLGGREVVLSGKGLKEVERVIQYYQHTGQLSKQKLSPEVRASVQKSVQAMCNASIPGTNGKMISGMHITEDTIALIRNAIFAVSPMGSADPIGTNLGYYTGLLGAFFAFREIDQGWTDYKRAKEVGDNEGKRRAAARLTRGCLVSGASSAFFVEKFLSPILSATASTVMVVGAQSFFGLGSLFSFSMSSLGALRCYRFNARLNEYLDNPHLSEEQRLQGALQFLKDQISVTEEEKEAMAHKIDLEHPLLMPEEKKDLLEKEIAKRAEVKVKYLKRRTSNRSLALIATQVDQILAKLSGPNASLEGIRDATVLLDKIQKENKTKLLLYALSIIASLLGLLGMLLFIFCPVFAALPFIIYGIAGMIYLGTTIYTAKGLFGKQPTELEYSLSSLSEVGALDTESRAK